MEAAIQMFTHASVMSRRVAGWTAAWRTARTMRIVIQSTPQTTMPADHAMPPYSSIQKCATIPTTPTSADA